MQHECQPLGGSQFLQDIAEFFLNFQSMYDGFVTRARAVERLLHDKRTTFAVVTTLEAAPLHEAERFCEALIARDYHLGALVLTTRGGDFSLRLGQEASIGYLSHNATEVQLYLQETLTFLTLTGEASVSLR